MRTLLFNFIIIFSAINLSANNIHSITEFASVGKGRELVVQEDDYTQSLSKFDLELRVPRDNPTLEDLNEFTSLQVLEWSKSEVQLLDSLTKIISDKVIEEGYKFKLPDNIYFVKSRMNENKGAGGYTRMNYIVFSKDIFARANPIIKEVIAHELFHIISRYNPELRTEIYSIIGFKVCNEIEITTALRDFTIANPDAPNIDSYITLEDKEGNSHKCAMILYSNRNYTTGMMMNYMKVGFLELEDTGDGKMKMKVEFDEKVLLPESNIANFYDQIGSNTQYVIHPEEIVASNFQLLFADDPTIRSPKIIEKMKEILKQGN